MVRNACLVGVLGFAMSALAQEPAPVSPYPPPPPPADVAPAGVPVATPTPVATETAHPMRIRGGIGTGPLVFLPNIMIGFAYEARVGAQINDRFGAYLTFGGTGAVGLSASASATGASASVSAASYNRLSAFADMLLGESAFVAAGPTFMFSGGWGSAGASASTTGGSVQAAAAVAPAFGAAVKLGYVAGADKADKVSGRRSGFTFSVDVAVLFAKQASVNASGGTTGASVGAQTDQPVLGIPVMLNFGYEWR